MGVQIVKTARFYHSIPDFPKFRKLSLDMLTDFKKHFSKYPATVSDITFTNMFCWNHLRKYEISELHGNILILTNVQGKKEFLCPIGKNKINDTVLHCLRYLKEHGHEPVMQRVSEEMKQEIQTKEIGWVEDEKNADYIYKLTDLVKLEGHDYKKKREDIRSLHRHYDFKFKPLTRGLIKYCQNFEKIWYRRRVRTDPEIITLEDEHKACIKILKEYSNLDLIGGVLLLNGQVKGFTIAEKMSENSFVAHFEKADRDIRGSYAALNWHFSVYLKKHFPEFQFVNREQDLGLDGLKFSKTHLHPFIKVNKYTLTLHD